MRIPGMGAEVLRKLGEKENPNIVNSKIKGDDIVNQHILGKINAAEWVNLYDDINAGLYPKFNYFYYPAWWEPSTTFEIQVNFTEWNELPSNYRAIFKSACWEVYLNLLAEYDDKNSLKLLEKIWRGDTA